MRADRDLRLAGRDRSSAACASRLLLAARKPGDLDAERAEPTGEFAEVLLGEDFGRRHDRDLPAVLDRLQRGERGDDRLAAADIALQQALHRMGLREIARDFGERALLRAR